MATSKKTLRDALRTQYMNTIENALVANGEDVLVVGTNEFAIPCVDGEGNDEFVVITVKVPIGSRDGDAYDGYAMAEEFRMKQTAKAEKARIAAEKKAKKIEHDKKVRAERAKAKAEHAQK